MLYTFDTETPQELMQILAKNLQRRRLEKGWSREALAERSGVPAATIAKFEQKHTVSLLAFVSMAKAMDYVDEIKALLSQPKYHTMAELTTINKNQQRKRGRNGGIK